MEQNTENKVHITVSNFGTMPDGRRIDLYTFHAGRGGELAVTNLGGKMVKLILPDKEGKMSDVIMGFDTAAPYLVRNPYFGTIVGRCANRIKNAVYSWKGLEYRLDANAGAHHLHGGAGGFDKRLWDAEVTEQGSALKISLFSEDGDQGYPGNLQVEVLYRFSTKGELEIEYKAKGDADTPVNLTNHCYFNLGGHDSGTILNHVLWLDSDAVTGVDEDNIPTGEILSVDGTPLDFREPIRIGERMPGDIPCMKKAEGYDLNYILKQTEKGKMKRFCFVKDPVSGRTMEGFTTMPAVQFYTANNIKGNFTFVGKGGFRYLQHCGFCLETQYYPDSVNRPEFPSVILSAGQEYREKTVFRFGAE